MRRGRELSRRGGCNNESVVNHESENARTRPGSDALPACSHAEVLDVVLRRRASSPRGVPLLGSGRRSPGRLARPRGAAVLGLQPERGHGRRGRLLQVDRGGDMEPFLRTRGLKAPEDRLGRPPGFLLRRDGLGYTTADATLIKEDRSIRWPSPERDKLPEPGGDGFRKAATGSYRSADVASCASILQQKAGPGSLPGPSDGSARSTPNVPPAQAPKKEPLWSCPIWAKCVSVLAGSVTSR
jgi:hypothetical protein